MSARRGARRASSQYWAMMWRTRSLAWRRRRSSAREGGLPALGVTVFGAAAPVPLFGGVLPVAAGAASVAGRRCGRRRRWLGRSRVGVRLRCGRNRPAGWRSWRRHSMGKLSVWTRGPRAGVECSGKRGRPGGRCAGSDCRRRCGVRTDGWRGRAGCGRELLTLRIRHLCKRGAYRGSKPKPSDPQSDALPLSYRRHNPFKSAGPMPASQHRWMGTVTPEKAGGQGFEPRLTDPKSVVLPLDDPPSLVRIRSLETGFRNPRLTGTSRNLPSGAEAQT